MLLGACIGQAKLLLCCLHDEKMTIIMMTLQLAADSWRHAKITVLAVSLFRSCPRTVKSDHKFNMKMVTSVASKK